MGKDPCKSTSTLMLNLEKGAAALGKQNKFASCLPKGQVEMQDFLSPGWDIATILITNCWNRNCFSWIYFFENFLHLLFTPFFSLKCALSFPNVEPCTFWSTEMPVIPKSTLGKHKCTQVFVSISRFLTSIVHVGCTGSAGYVPNQEVKSFKQCIV